MNDLLEETKVFGLIDKNTVRLDLLDDSNKNGVKYGLNWAFDPITGDLRIEKGKSESSRSGNESYLQLPKDVYMSDFFPESEDFHVTDDLGNDFIFNRSQPKVKDGKPQALSTPESNKILGLYIRHRLGLRSGALITKADLLNYGRTDIIFKKDDNNLYMDFSSYKGKNGIKKITNNPLQQIFYGAPGTGKSHTINEITEQQPKENVFRTTFHPDSDYSTFVGCYKPTKEETKTQSQSILDYDSLVNKFKEYLDVKNPYQNITRACTLFGYDFHDSIVRMQDGNTHTIPELVTDAYKSGTTYDSQVRAGMACYEEAVKPQTSSSKITYSFVPQAFTKAYLRAWQTTDPVYLVIEEINRGNCAQIFGDLFQLLDRKNGVGEYPIKPDDDLGRFIAENLTNPVEGIPDEIRVGKELSLPANLYIWATMNTSDQSLFPIDSAFKRRWEWKYIPINTQKENWSIAVNGTNYDWSDFLEKINARIESATSSEDKMLGFYFCKAENNIIGADRFVSKVLFYLWNDVFKDYGFDDAIFNDEKGQKLSFRNFYKLDGTVDENKVKRFLDNLQVKGENDGPNGEDENSENAPGVTEKQLRFWQGFNNARKNNQEYCQIYTEKAPLGQQSMDLSFGTSAYRPFMSVLFNKSLIYKRLCNSE